MQSVGVTQEDIRDRVRRRQITRKKKKKKKFSIQICKGNIYSREELKMIRI